MNVYATSIGDLKIRDSQKPLFYAIITCVPKKFKRLFLLNCFEMFNSGQDANVLIFPLGKVDVSLLQLIIYFKKDVEWH